MPPRLRYLGLTVEQLVLLSFVGLVAFGVFGFGALLLGRALFAPQPLAAPAKATVAAPTSYTEPNTQWAFPTFPPTWTAAPTFTQQSDSTQKVAASDTPLATVTVVETYTPLPTYTPYPTLTPQPTFTPYPSQTRAPPPTSTELVIWSQVATYTGSGSTSTSTLHLDPGFTRVSWNYSGSGQPGQLTPAEEAYHTQVLSMLEQNYQSTKAVYDQSLQQAIASRDAYWVNYWQNALSQLESQYQSSVNSENQRYEAAKAAAATRPDQSHFAVWVGRLEGRPELFLGETYGPGFGSNGFQSLGGDDYYFRVEAGDGWTLSIEFQPCAGRC